MYSIVLLNYAMLYIMVPLRQKSEHNAYMDRCTCTTTGLGRHMGICLWVVDTYSTDQMLAFESVGRVVSNVECGWSTYNLFFHDIFSEFYRHMINPVYFCACLTAVSTDTSTKWISMYQSMGSLGHFVVQCPIHIFGFVDVPGMSTSCSSVVARIHRTRPAPACGDPTCWRSPVCLEILHLWLPWFVYKRASG